MDRYLLEKMGHPVNVASAHSTVERICIFPTETSPRELAAQSVRIEKTSILPIFSAVLGSFSGPICWDGLGDDEKQMRYDVRRTV